MFAVVCAIILFGVFYTLIVLTVTGVLVILFLYDQKNREQHSLNYFNQRKRDLRAAARFGAAAETGSSFPSLTPDPNFDDFFTENKTDQREKSVFNALRGLNFKLIKAFTNTFSPIPESESETKD